MLNIAAKNELSTFILLPNRCRKNDGSSHELLHLLTMQQRDGVDIITLIEWADQVMDTFKHPQAAMPHRAFTNAKPRSLSRGEYTEMAKSNNKEYLGEKGTFIIHVISRQNATWQGSVSWADRNETQRFRSTLELIKLIDGALDTNTNMNEKDETEGNR